MITFYVRLYEKLAESAKYGGWEIWVALLLILGLTTLYMVTAGTYLSILISAIFAVVVIPLLVIFAVRNFL